MSNFLQRQDHQHGKTKKSFIKAKMDALKAINDTAERAIGFVAKHNSNPRTTSEETFQEILQSAENHCRRVPNVKKI
jgi:phosphoribosylanthranilate isomerase